MLVKCRGSISFQNCRRKMKRTCSSGTRNMDGWHVTGMRAALPTLKIEVMTHRPTSSCARTSPFRNAQLLMTCHPLFWRP